MKKIATDYEFKSIDRHAIRFLKENVTNILNMV